MYEKLSSSRSKYEGFNDFHSQNGLIYHFNALCVPIGERIGLIREAHTLKIAGHFGVEKILYNLQRYVYWPNMQDQVAKYIRVCSLCCTNMPSNRKLVLYQPLQVPSHPWECISMDFMEGFPMNKKGHDYLFIVVDRFSKMCIFIPYKKLIMGQDVVNLVFSHV